MKKIRKWSFDNEDIDFDEHVRTSIPFYEETHKLISYLSTFFIKDHSVVYEIGCSTGTLLNKISLYNDNSTVEYIGIEPSTKLTKIALDKYGDKIKIINSTVQKESIKKSDLVISHFMLQFISVGERSSLLKKLYESLREGGGFILFEKNHFDDVKLDHIMGSVYNYDFKKNNKYSLDSIFDKAYSLRGVMDIMTQDENKKLLQENNFKKISCIFKWGQFTGFLCIK